MTLRTLPARQENRIIPHNFLSPVPRPPSPASRITLSATMFALRLLSLLWMTVVGLGAQETLSTLSSLRQLSAEEAAAAVPVQIEGTVVGLEPSSPFHFFVHDGTTGCFVKTHPSARSLTLTPGDRVSITGLSDPLGYYPSIRDGRIHLLGKAPLPSPITPAVGDLFAPHLDSAWVEVPAVVTGYELGNQRLTLAVEVHGLPFKAELPLTADAGEKAAALMQRPARLTGIMGTIFNRQRQMTDRHFFLPSLASITPNVPLDPSTARPTLSISQLLTGPYGPTAHVRITGTVTQQDAKGFYLRDASGSTLVMAAHAADFPPGTSVAAEGFAAVAAFRPLLRATHVVPTSTSPLPPAPVALPAQPLDSPALHAEKVTLSAEFLGHGTSPFHSVLQFRRGDHFFEALHPDKDFLPRFSLTPGDQVQLTGICRLTTTHALPRIDWVDGFQILLPATGGIAVLRHAPWWTPRRLLIALGLMSAVAALGFSGAWLLRRQVKSQMQIISGKLRAEAVGEERDRMARELHDTLEQQLSGVALQLDSLDHAVKQNPAAATATLSLARRMLRYTRLEARRSVWDLRSSVLEKEGLTAALHAIPDSSGPTGPAIHVTVTGPPRPTAPGVDFHLFRIAQEAATNALKHSGATTLRIHLEYLPNTTRLTITDDGRGFDPAASYSPGPHFGLLGMRERAGKIGAHFQLTAQPDTGCTIVIDVPT